MKKFFSKIGKGFKKVLKGIGKVLNSKIGKIIGTVFMAYNLVSLFSKMFVKKAATDVLIAGAGEVAGEVATDAAAQAAGTQVAGKGAEIAAREVAGEIGGRSLLVDQTSLIDTEKLMASLTDVNAPYAGRLTGPTATEASFNLSLTDSPYKVGTSKDPFDNVVHELFQEIETNPSTNLTAKPSLENVSTKMFSKIEKITEGVPHAVTTTPDMLSDPRIISSGSPGLEVLAEGVPLKELEVTPVWKPTEHIFTEKALKAPFTPDELKSIIINEPNTATAAKLDYASTGYSGVELPENPTVQEVTRRNLEISFNRSRPKTIQDTLADPAFRETYETSFAGESGILKHPEMYGSSKSTSFVDAWQSRESLLGGVGDVIQHGMGKSIGEFTGGAYTGVGSTRSAAGTAFVGTQYALAATADAPEEPVAPNYMARSMAKHELGKAEAFTESVDSQTLTSQVDWNAPPDMYMNQMQNIVAATGVPYLYGPRDFNFGHSRLTA